MQFRVLISLDNQGEKGGRIIGGNSADLSWDVHNPEMIDSILGSISDNIRKIC